MEVIIASIIGGVATILAAYVGNRSGQNKGFKSGHVEGYHTGYKEGLEKGRTHSILRFLDEHESSIDRAIRYLDRKDFESAEATCDAIVENVRVWRGIQENFRELLNGLVDQLARAVESRDPQALNRPLRAIREAFPARRLAVETELDKSKI